MRKILICLLAALVATQLGVAQLAFASPGYAVADSAEGEGTGAGAGDSTTEGYVVTISDLVLVARDLNGEASLSSEDLVKYDLTADGKITIADLVMLADRLKAEQPGGDLIGEAEAKRIALEQVEGATAGDVTSFGTSEVDGKTVYDVEITLGKIVYSFRIDGRTGEILDASNAPGFPVPEPEYQTICVNATVLSVDEENGSLTIKPTAPEGAQGSDEIVAHPAEGFAIVNAETGDREELSDLEEGETVNAFLGAAMTASIPPQAACYAAVTNATTEVQVDYIRVMEAAENDMGITVLNQNADLYVTIPSDLPIEVLGEDDTVSAEEIKDGSRLFVWYEVVLETYPMQTTASRAVLIPDQAR